MKFGDIDLFKIKQSCILFPEGSVDDKYLGKLCKPIFLPFTLLTFSWILQLGKANKNVTVGWLLAVDNGEE